MSITCESIAENIIGVLKRKRLDVSDEKRLQSKIFEILFPDAGNNFLKKEYRLDDKNIIDFLAYDHIGIEVKIKGSKRQIYEQCVRYCEFDEIKVLIVVSNRVMGLPETINGKSIYFLKLGAAWL